MSGCDALCALASAEATVGDPALSSAPLHGRQRALARDERKSRINGGRRKRPPPKPLLPAVRAVDGSFQVVKSDVCLSRENSVWRLIQPEPLFATDQAASKPQIYELLEGI